jgi:hypothetical protein
MATAQQRERAAATIAPRLLSRMQAAVYVGLSATEFDTWAQLNRVRPIRHGRRVLFDRRQLDLVIDHLVDMLDSKDAGRDDPFAPARQVTRTRLPPWLP